MSIFNNGLILFETVLRGNESNFASKIFNIMCYLNFIKNSSTAVVFRQKRRVTHQGNRWFRVLLALPNKGEMCLACVYLLEMASEPITRRAGNASL